MTYKQEPRAWLNKEGSQAWLNNQGDVQTGVLPTGCSPRTQTGVTGTAKQSGVISNLEKRRNAIYFFSLWIHILSHDILNFKHSLFSY